VQLSGLRGRPQVVVLFFASCTAACPILVHDLQRIEAALPEAARDHAHFTLVTIDTERDTPEALHAFRQSRHLPEARWTLLRGAPDDTLELAALLGVKYKREASGQFAHSNLITLLSDSGEILHQLAGLNQDVKETTARLEKALAAHQTHH
jgi:protein SCO1